jgi:hypothetical protein
MELEALIMAKNDEQAELLANDFECMAITDNNIKTNKNPLVSIFEIKNLFKIDDSDLSANWTMDTYVYYSGGRNLTLAQALKRI